MALVVLVALVAPPAPVAPVELAALAAQGQPNEITNRDRQNRGAESAPDRTIWLLGKMPELYCQKMMDLYGVFGRLRFTARQERRGITRH